jgi:N-glycosidase YbiA
MIDFHGLDTPNQVFFYEQDFYVLSNFSAFKVSFRGIDFNTSEEAYHFQRFAADGIRNEVRNNHITALLRCRSAHDAFRYAQKHKADQLPNWDDVKVGIMRDILRAKAGQHEYVRRKLLATGDRELVENSWRDSFWGWGPDRKGQNMLGRLWMELRGELLKVQAA